MKKVTILFIISFSLSEFFLALRLFFTESSAFADFEINLIVNILFFMFSLCLIRNFKWYKIESNR